MTTSGYNYSAGTIQHITRVRNYDNLTAIMAERLAIIIMKQINNSCRKQRVGMRARYINHGIVMEYHQSFINPNV